MAMVYHIAFVADWADGRRDGEYRISTRGRTLEQQGFIHAGTAGQVTQVANTIYADAQDLVVLVIDEDSGPRIGTGGDGARRWTLRSTLRVTSKVHYDDVPGSDEPFPHIYGPLNIDAVVQTLPLEQGSDGRFSFAPPPEL
jgi:uncharacterized protein (DUF952 family)